MRFVETPVFTREASRYLPDDEYRALQLALALRPEQGAVIPGSGGLRKVRWSAPGRGRRGGLRVIYHRHRSSETIYMLLAYAKSDRDDLTRAQLRILRRLVEGELP